MSEGRRRRGIASVLPLLPVVAVAAFAALNVDRSWAPHDEGMLGQSAVRILQGELPHRDYDAVYTGGLEFFHAGVMRVAGVDLVWLRYALLGAFLVWLVFYWRVARRLLAPWSASAVVSLGALLTLPQWPAALPSWYNLFLLTAGVWALCRHAERGETRWMLLAGFLAGVSVLVKIVGLYALAAVLLYAVFSEGLAPGAGEPVGRRRTTVWLAGAYAVGLTLLVAALVRAQWSGASLALYVLPVLAVSGAAFEAVRRAPAPAWSRMLARGVAACTGAAVPIGLFVLFYALEGGVAQLAHGTLVAPRIRFTAAAQAPSALSVLAIGLLAGLPLVAERRLGARGRWILAAACALCLAAGVVMVGKGVLARGAVQVLRSWMVLAVLWASVRLARSGDDRTSNGRLAALAAATALWGLVQFPFAAEFYVFYVAPLALLLLAALAAPAVSMPGGPRPVAALAVAVFVAYGVVNSRHTLGPATARMEGVHASLRVPPLDRARYQALLDTIRTLEPGTYLYATADAPEVPYMAGLRDPTRTLYDFLDDPEGRDARILAALERHDVRVAVLKDPGPFSGPVPPGLRRALEARFPRRIEVGGFTVLSREPAAARRP